MLAALRGVRLNVPQQKHPLPNGLAWYVCALFVYGLAVNFAGTLEIAAESLSHAKQMYNDGILLRAKHFARPASDHSNMHASMPEGTTQIETNWVQKLELTIQQSALGNDFSCQSSPVRFGLRGGGDAAPGDAGGDADHRRRRSVRCAR